MGALFFCARCPLPAANCSCQNYRVLRRPVALLLGVVALGVVLFVIVRSRDRLPSPDSPEYEEITRTFYRGLASLQVGLLDGARQDFTQATELVPREPASWANLGLTELRLGELDAAAASIERALTLAPDSGGVALLAGRMEVARGRAVEGAVHLRRAVQVEPTLLRARFALAEALEQAGGPTGDADAQAAFEELVQLQPQNLAVLLERTRLAAKRNDAALLRDCVARLDPLSAGWPAAAVEQYRPLEQAAAAADFAAASRAASFLRNVLAPLPAFQDSLVAVRTPQEVISEPFDRFLLLTVPSSMPSPHDDGLTYTSEPAEIRNVAPTMTMQAVSLDGTGAPVIVSADLALDWNNDFRTDLVVLGANGVRLLMQSADGSFADQTPAFAPGASAGTPAQASRAWAADIEMDGDLDVVVGVTSGSPFVLRNNGNGTWTATQPFAGVSGLRSFAWADLDRDGDPDAVLLDAGGVRVFANRQAGAFSPIASPPANTDISTLAAGDVNSDGTLDLVTIDSAGTIRRASYVNGTWSDAVLATWAPASGGAMSRALFLVDLDNNGALDLLASTDDGRSAAWLAAPDGTYQALAVPSNVDVIGVGDLNVDGTLDLAARQDGRVVRLTGRGSRGYHWQVVRPRAQQLAGDQRINSFGVGGEVEVRSGLLTQKQILTGGPVHFGLGTHTAVDVARIVWPNGVMQAEFGPAIDQAITAEQRLKGSCPWLFAYDGTAMRFVTDFLWRSPLGLRINAVDTAGVAQTEDRVKIRGEQLRPLNGLYDVRITAELWETHFVDQVALLVVDHPEDTEVYIDERFARESPSLDTRVVRTPRSIMRALDHHGADVTELVAQQDGRHLATFARGAYQGIAEDHFVEIELERPLAADGPRWLVAYGWIYPTDSSINVAIGQGGHVQPRGLSFEAQDASGRWVVVAPDLGFPAGKNKTILIDLKRVTDAGVGGARRLRLRTNLEIYWDWLAIADAVERPELRTVLLKPSLADLRYRGFSQTDHSRRDVPETPLYDRLASRSQQWRDLVGYYTRFGDVGELVDRVDDRYVIMNAGDELELKFPEVDPPAPGWTRDFVLIGDGWEKDGDFNTGFSQTVEPLPSHDRPEYASDVRSLDADPVYRRHSADWQRYHTRYVTPRDYLSGLNIAR